MKTRVLPWAVGVAILGCVLAVSANVTTSKMYDNLSNERHARMDVERQLLVAVGRVRALETRLAISQKKFDNIQAILNQGRSTANDLQTRLEQVTQEKENLVKKMAEIQNQPANPSNSQVSR